MSQLNRFRSLAVAAALMLPLSLGAVAQEPVNQTPAAQTPADAGVPQAAPLTKKDMKAQQKQQKAGEHAAHESAKAQKDRTNALKHQDKATDAAERANPPQ